MLGGLHSHSSGLFRSSLFRISSLFRSSTLFSSSIFFPSSPIFFRISIEFFLLVHLVIRFFHFKCYILSCLCGTFFLCSLYCVTRVFMSPRVNPFSWALSLTFYVTRLQPKKGLSHLCMYTSSSIAPTSFVRSSTTFFNTFLIIKNRIWISL